VPLEKVYSFNPIPQELTADEQQYILGVQGNIWTEYIKTPEQVEYMAFPRAIALAEVAWTPQENRNYEEFRNRLNANYERLDKQNVNYRIPEPDGITNVVVTQGNSAKVELTPYSNQAKILYTTDKTEPTDLSKVYSSPIEIEFAVGQVYREIKMVVVNPKGRKSSIYSVILLKRELVEPIEPSGKNAGVTYSLYKGNFGTVEELDKNLVPFETGETKSIQLSQFKAKTGDLKEPFAVVFSGYFNVSEDAIYEFEIDADDKAVFYIDREEAIVGNDKSQPNINKKGVVPLKKGFHKFTLKYIQRGENSNLKLSWGMKGQGLERIWGGELVH
jgi:hexosaminidase